MNVRSSRALVALVAFSLAACGDDGDDAASTADTSTVDTATAATPHTAGADTTDASAPPTTQVTTTTLALADALGDRTYLSTDVDGYDLVEGTRIELTFDGPNVSASAGCNQLASAWSLDGDTLVIGPMAMTQMACEPATLMDQDTWLSAVLTSNPTVSLDDDTLLLTAADGTVVHLLDKVVAEPDQPLEGTNWTVEGLVTNDAVSSVTAGARAPSLRLEDGTVTVDTGCNTGRGSYTSTATEITFGPIATTRMACDPAVSSAEQTVLATLTGTAAYEIDADQLRLTNGPTGLVLRAPGDGAVSDVEASSWTLDSTISGSTTTAVPAGVRTPTLSFEEGTVTVDTGCNTGSGTYTIAGDQVTFGPIAMTLMLCDDASNAVEQAVVAVLTGTATATVNDGVLQLVNGDQGLMFLAA